MITAYFDGACWPNPGGHAACGALLKRDGVTIWEYAEYLGSGKTSNNLAEYGGIVAVLSHILDINLKEDLIIYGDSDLVIRQMNGIWKIRRTKPGKEPKFYVAKALEAKDLEAKCVSAGMDITYKWIPREQNTEADALSNKPLIERGYRESRGRLAPAHERTTQLSLF